MKAFKSPVLPVSMHIAFCLALVSFVLVSTQPEVASARTRPIADMGDPDPTEGASKAGHVSAPVSLRDHSVALNASSSQRQLRDYLLVWRWIIWR